MAWWAIAYCVVLLAWSVAALVDDRSSGRPWMYLAWGAFSSLCAPVLVVAYSVPRMANAAGLWAPLLFATAVSFEITSACVDVRSLRDGPEEDGTAVKLGFLAALALYAPALYLGAVVSLRSLGLLV